MCQRRKRIMNSSPRSRDLDQNLTPSEGSIEASKDADFLVFDNDLLTSAHEGFSHNKPKRIAAYLSSAK